jgi:hypothetical protein
LPVSFLLGGLSLISFIFSGATKKDGGKGGYLLGSGPILALPRMSPLIEYILSSAQLSVSVCPLSEFTDTDITGPSCLPSTLRSCCVERATRKNQSRKAARYCADIVQYSTSHNNTSQGGCDTVHHNTISQLNTIQYSTIQYNTIHVHTRTTQYTYIHVQHNTRTYTYNTIHVHTRTISLQSLTITLR